MNAKTNLGAADHGRRRVLTLGAGLAAAMAAPRGFAQAEGKPAVVNLGVATIPKIWAVGKYDGSYDKALGTSTKWISYDSGAVLLPMFAANVVDIAIVGSPPIAASIARKLPIKVIGAPEIINTSERLIARDGINSLKDLIGKRVAFPGASTLEYAFERGLEAQGVDSSKIRRLTLGQAEIVAAWRRGDIDAAYVAGPFWSDLLKNGGHQILASGQLQPKTYVWNGVIVRTAFADKYPTTVAKCLQTMQAMYNRYKADPVGQATSLAKNYDVDPQATRQSLEGLSYPSFEEQLSAKYFGSGPDTPNAPLVKSLDDQGRFLAKLGEIRADTVPASYAPYVDVALMQRAFPAK